MRVFILPVLMFVAACAGPIGGGGASGPALPEADMDTCDAAEQAGLLGQDATALEETLIMRQVRVIRPGDIVTQEYRAERINFEINTAGKISRIRCG